MRSLKMLRGTGNPHTSRIILGNEKTLHLPELLLLLFLVLRNGRNVSMSLYVPVEYDKFPLIYL